MLETKGKTALGKLIILAICAGCSLICLVISIISCFFRIFHAAKSGKSPHDEYDEYSEDIYGEIASAEILTLEEPNLNFYNTIDRRLRRYEIREANRFFRKVRDCNPMVDWFDENHAFDYRLCLEQIMSWDRTMIIMIDGFNNFYSRLVFLQTEAQRGNIDNTFLYLVVTYFQKAGWGSYTDKPLPIIKKCNHHFCDVKEKYGLMDSWVGSPIYRLPALVVDSTVNTFLIGFNYYQLGGMRHAVEHWNPYEACLYTLRFLKDRSIYVDSHLGHVRHWTQVKFSGNFHSYGFKCTSSSHRIYFDFALLHFQIRQFFEFGQHHIVNSQVVSDEDLVYSRMFADIYQTYNQLSYQQAIDVEKNKIMLGVLRTFPCLSEKLSEFEKNIFPITMDVSPETYYFFKSTDTLRHLFSKSVFHNEWCGKLHSGKGTDWLEYDNFSVRRCRTYISQMCRLIEAVLETNSTLDDDPELLKCAMLFITLEKDDEIWNPNLEGSEILKRVVKHLKLLEKFGALLPVPVISEGEVSIPFNNKILNDDKLLYFKFYLKDTHYTEFIHKFEPIVNWVNANGEFDAGECREQLKASFVYAKCMLYKHYPMYVELGMKSFAQTIVSICAHQDFMHLESCQLIEMIQRKAFECKSEIFKSKVRGLSCKSTSEFVHKRALTYSRKMNAANLVKEDYESLSKKK